MFQCCDCDSDGTGGAACENSRKFANYLSTRLKEVIPIRCIGYSEITKNLSVVEFLTRGRVEFKFMAGQFVGIHSHDLNKVFAPSDVKSGIFSIVSPPSLLPVIKVAVVKTKNEVTIDKFLFFGIKINDILFMDKEAWGTVAVTPRMLINPLEGPRGLCLISGGTAIMSHIAIIEELLVNPDGQTLPKPTVIHSNRLPTEIPFYKQLTQLAQNKKIDYVLQITGQVANDKFPKFSQLGRITKDLLRSKIHCQRLYCVSGPEPMVENVISMLLDLGVWPASIRTDFVTKSYFSPRNSCEEPFSMSFKNVFDRFERPKFTSNAITSKQPLNDTSYFEDNGLNEFFTDLMKNLETEKPANPFTFCVEKMRIHAEKEQTEASGFDHGDLSVFLSAFSTSENSFQQIEPISTWLKTFSKVTFGPKARTIIVSGLKSKSDIIWLLNQNHFVILSKETFARKQNSKSFDSLNFSSATKEFTEKRAISVSEVFFKSPEHPNLRFSKVPLDKLNPELIGSHIDCYLDFGYFDSLNSESEFGYLNYICSLMKRNGSAIFTSMIKTPLTDTASPSVIGKRNVENTLERHFKKLGLLTVVKNVEKRYEVAESIYLAQNPLNIFGDQPNVL